MGLNTYKVYLPEEGKKLINQRTALESRLQAAEDRLLDKTLAKDDYIRLSEKVKSQIAKVTDSLNELHEAQEIQVDVAQEI